nr:ydcI [Bacillus subtilis] [Bacillus subtilis subsp. subtilis str. 168]
METSALLKQQIAKEIGLSQKHVESVIRLLEDGNTVPFIARYRKEQTGSMDEVQIQTISERWQYIQNLNQRKEEVIRLIAEQDKLTDNLKRKIEQSVKLQEVEDLYRPYKQKRKTKATVAKSKGLEPLADYILTLPQDDHLAATADQYISEEKEVFTREEAIEGAKHIIAEQISDEPTFRKWIRQETFKRGTIKSAAGKSADTDEKNVYEMYYEYEEPIAKVVPHRVLAMNRGEKEDILKVAIEPPADHIKAYLEKQIIKNRSTSVREILQETIEDSYKRLIQPAIEREIRKELSEKADEQAIHIFSENLRKLLLQPPMKGKTVLGVDPAFRTGCKLAVSDETGKVLKIDVIYPHAPVNKTKEAHEKVKKILEQYQVEMVAIGNGTASRETEQFIVNVLRDMPRKIYYVIYPHAPVNKTKEAHEKVKKILEQYQVEMVAIGNGTASRETEQFIVNVLRDMPRKIYYVIVNEAGASVYSASELAREEFPDLKVEERSAVSIARRLQDPLAELVKIDPKSVGVGQYQHDVSQKRLNESLRFVVETVVNQVGVNVNTASAALLQYVAGLSKSVAGNVVKKREEIGKFSNRKELKDIPRLGAKTYEQCIGFLRVQEGTEPLDRTGIHPESYKETKALLKKLGLSTEHIGTAELKDKINQWRSLKRQKSWESAKSL